MGNSLSNGGRRFSDWVCGLFVRLGNVIWSFLDFDLINFVSRHVSPMLLLKSIFTFVLHYINHDCGQTHANRGANGN